MLSQHWHRLYSSINLIIMRHSFLYLVIWFCLFVSLVTNAQSIQYDNNTIKINLTKTQSLNAESGKQQILTDRAYVIQRAKGRFGNYQTIAETSFSIFEDKSISGSPYDYYYKIIDSKDNSEQIIALDIELFGPNFYLYSPEDNMTAIRNEINSIHDNMLHQEFSSNRYAFNFKPGNYTGAGVLNIAYYTHIGGLGKLPTDVKLSNVHTPAPLPNNNATCTFWRSMENAMVSGRSDGDMYNWFQWAVSQAAPLRRVYSEKRAHYQWWYDGWCSGGFTGDCYFADRAGSWSQQQWYFRNSFVNLGSKDYSKGGWNLCYQGMEFGPTVNMADHTDNWNSSGGAWNNVSNVDKTPIIREKPFLFIGDDGRYKIFKPTLRYDSKGISWSTSDMGEGETLDLLDDFYVVKPGTSAETMNEQLASGKHLFITPGMYELSEPLYITRPNTIVLGTGYATLIPSAANPTSAIVIDDVDGVTVAGFLLDAHYNSRTLVQVGHTNSLKNHSANPTLLADLFFRVGGFRSENVHVDVALEINSSDVIGDHFWIWRADHGSGVGWFKNTAKNGLVVNGHYVTIYGLFNEHFQEYQTLWNGEKGRLYFLQCESPYDPQKQSDYMSHNGTVKGYAAYKVADHVQYHEASMLGIYDVFVNTNGAEIAIDNSIETPNSSGVTIHNACNVNISTLGGINYVINGQVSSTFNKNIANRFYIVDYAGTETPISWERPEEGFGTSVVNHPSIESDFFIFNPESHKVFLPHVEKMDKVQLFDLTGKLLFSQFGDKTIDVDKMISGVYVICLTNATDTLSERILIR